MASSTSKSHWTLDQLKSQLASRSQVKGWIVKQEHVQRRERYFLQDGAALGIDQDRETGSSSTFARIFVKLGKEGRQGEITKKLSPLKPLGEQLDSAVQAALQTDHQAWDLPAQPQSRLPELKTADPRIAEDMESVVTALTSRIGLAVEKPRKTRFNSAELFVSLHDQELHFSNGLIHRNSQSRIYSEAAFSMSRKNAQGKPESDEYLNTQWAVHSEDLALEKLFDETADRAEHSLDVVKPQTGTYPVIVDAEVLATLFHGHLTQLGAMNQYNRLPFIKAGDEFIPNAAGDRITMTLDPTLEYGGDTSALSDQGVPQKPLELVRENRVLATASDKQFADYLNLPVSTSRGNLVVAPGSMTYDELCRSAPKVIEILQFSGLFADPNSGTFSSEIRLARLYDNVTGKVTYLKGGSLSGSVTENFRGVRLSKHRVRRSHFSSDNAHGQGYYGPEHALLSEVSIVG